MKFIILVSPVPRWVMGSLAGSGLKLCIRWKGVWACQVEAQMSLTPR